MRLRHVTIIFRRNFVRIDFAGLISPSFNIIIITLFDNVFKEIRLFFVNINIQIIEKYTPRTNYIPG